MSEQLKINEEIKLLELITNELVDEMSCESKNTEEWLTRAERFIVAQRKLNRLYSEIKRSEK